jgi:3-hydroxyacyl-CoA dehydrogenase
MAIKKVLVVGVGTMGQQIGFQVAMHGFDTVMFNFRQPSLDACKAAHQSFGELFLERGTPAEEVDAALARISYSTDLEAACRGIDLVSESIIEDLEAKQQLYPQLDRHCPEHTLFTTNTSTLLPSEIAEATGRPDRFMAMHFVVGVWDHNVVELMAPSGTSRDTFDAVQAFTRDIGMVPVTILKEQPGYIINSLLVPWAVAAQSLVSNGVSSPEDVDRTWMISTGMQMGPFGFMDAVGIGTVHTIFEQLAAATGDPQHRKNADYLQTEFIAQNKLGMKTGEGYYRYPHPAYQGPDFTR